MKKQAKALAVLSTAMFMAAVTPAFLNPVPYSYAKSAGWTEENGNWYYYDSYGEPLTDTWKKLDNDWYYLDSDGIRAVSTQIDEYYVDEDGKRVSMKWVSVDNEDYWDDNNAPEKLHYYYGKDGKALTSRWASIGGNWYYFNEDGIMETGSITVDGYNYYLGEDGIRKTGWVLLEDETDEPEYNESWYYFDNSGKRIENEVDKKINGNYYTFVDGRMQTGWYKLPASETISQEQKSEQETEAPQTASPSEAQPAAEDASSPQASVAAAYAPAASHHMEGYQYYDEDGKRASGWREIEGVEGISEEAELYHFYFKNGKPHYAKKGLELFTIDSKKYAFNDRGEMQTGKKVVNLEDGSTANFYFDENGVMKTGKQAIMDEDTGETQNWYFHTDGSRKGQGYSGIKDNVLYVSGLRQEADRDLRFAPAQFDGVHYLVNSNGVVQKASSSSKSSAMPELGKGFKDFKDENDTVWTVSTEGVIQELHN